MGRCCCKIGGVTFWEMHPIVTVLIQQHAVDARSTFVQLYCILNFHHHYCPLKSS